MGSESAFCSASLTGAAAKLLFFSSAGKLQLLDCGCDPVASILGILFQKVIRLKRDNLTQTLL
jgi:hypothetical protein